MKPNMFRLAALLFIGGLCVGQTMAQTVPMMGHIAPITPVGGEWVNTTDTTVRVFGDTIQASGSTWIRLYFGDVSLPPGSYVQVTSLQDGETQRLDAAALSMWSSSSAYFNGDTVAIEIFAGPRTNGTRLFTTKIGRSNDIAPEGGSGVPGICGADNRSPSGELWAARLAPATCTAIVYCPTGSGMLTAGHCLENQSAIVAQFNVPTGCPGAQPAVNDQFPVLPGFQFENVGPGDDWGVLITGTNSLGQVPIQRYGDFHALSDSEPTAGMSTNLVGYGEDLTCSRHLRQQSRSDSVTSVDSKLFVGRHDIQGGDSGGGAMDQVGMIHGLLTHGDLNGCAAIFQRADDQQFSQARDIVNFNCGAGVPQGAPSNDLCTSPLEVFTGVTRGVFANATQDTTSCAGSGPDMWFRFTPQCSGTFTIDLCRDTFWDTVLSVYSGCPTEGGGVIACNDDFCGQASSVDVQMQAGVSYLIRLGAKAAGQIGTFRLNIQGGGVSFDRCENAEILLPGITQGSNACATTDGSAPCAVSSGKDVWYRFTPFCTGLYVFDTCSGTNFNTVLSLVSGCGGTPIACNDNSCSLNGPSSVSAQLQAGVDVLLRVAGVGGQSGNYTLTVTTPGSFLTPNDLCANATPVPPGDVVEGSFSCSTRDGSINCPGTGSNMQDIWFSYTATCTGMQGAAFFSEVLAPTATIHSACPGTAFNQIACATLDDITISGASWFQVAGSTVYFRVAQVGSAVRQPVFVFAGPESSDSSNFPKPVTEGQYFFNTESATTSDFFLNSHCSLTGAEFGADAWFSYASTCAGSITISTCGSEFATNLAVYNAFPDIDTLPVACGLDSCFMRSQVQITVNQGDELFIRVGGKFNSRGCGVLNITACSSCAWVADGCAADYDNNDSIDGDDVIAFFAAWDNSDSCADANSDGSTDGDDVISFFGSWDTGGVGAPGC
ncbi:MAG: hypothetical protein ACK54H_06020 [Phycisphaerales bacterium]